MNERILIVDDDPAIVTTLQRYLSRHLEVETASSAAAALAAIEANGPYAVVMSDLNMPGMNGIELLARIKEKWPDTVRVLLTGQFDIDSAITAVNEGYIFRFLTKPCPSELLLKTLKAAMVQFRLGVAEHEVLEETLLGALAILTEILSLVHPMAFSRAGILRCYVRLMVDALRLPDSWQIEAAALLSQIGLISVPSDTLEKLYLGEPLQDDELLAFAAHPAVGQRLLYRIPRLRLIAAMVGSQQRSYEPIDPQLSPDAVLTTLGGQILRITLDLDRLINAGNTHEEAIAELKTREGEYNPKFLKIIESINVAEVSPETTELGMFAGNPAVTLGSEGTCLATPLAAQVWEALNNQDPPVSRVLPRVSSAALHSPEPATTTQHEVIEGLVSYLDRRFDATYLALTDPDERLLLRQLFLLARDALCDIAGKSFEENRVAADKIAAELRLQFARTQQEIGDEMLRLPLLVPVVSLATRLASLVDRPPLPKTDVRNSSADDNADRSEPCNCN